MLFILKIKNMLNQTLIFKIRFVKYIFIPENCSYEIQKGATRGKKHIPTGWAKAIIMPMLNFSTNLAWREKRPGKSRGRRGEIYILFMMKWVAHIPQTYSHKYSREFFFPQNCEKTKPICSSKKVKIYDPSVRGARIRWIGSR